MALLISFDAISQKQSNLNNTSPINKDFCGTDFFHQRKMETDLGYRERFLQLKQQIQQLQTQKNPVAGIYQVPVVVHVMHKGEAVGSGTNISDDDVKRGIQYLNNFWRKVAGSYGDGDGIDMKIEFTLAVQDESGNCTDGIDRVDMSGVSAYVNNGVNRNNSNGIDDYNSGGGINSLKEYSIWDPTQYYNVWLVDEIDNKNCYSGTSYTAGYAYYSSAHGQPYDGSVVLICSYLDDSDVTWAHEMGHAFNLPHTFDGDDSNNDGVGDQCGDDGIFDTPSHIRTSSISGLYFDCTNTDPNTCDASFSEITNPDNGFTRNTGTHQDHMHNYMDYTGCATEFTGGQRTVAQAAMTGARSSFLSSPALTPPLPATVDFSSAASVACTNGSITFTDQSSCTPNTYTNTGYTGISFAWTFDNGVDAPYTSTDQNPTITFANSGTYDVTLEVTNPQGTTSLTKTDFITVTSGATNGCSVSSGNNNGNFGCGVTYMSFNTMTNSTSTNIPASALNDFTCSVNTSVSVGTPYDLNITYNSRSDGGHNLEVWIDWDNSGTFETSNSNGDNERVMTDNIAASSTGTPSASVTPPASATLNTLLRMRVISDYNQTPTVCGNGFVQRADDYGVLVQSACTNPDVPTISGTTTICNGNSTTLSINTGNLNDASDWQWYTSSCGGTSAGSGTSINVSPNTTTMYYVRGEGGCVSAGSCASVEVVVNDAPSISSNPNSSTINDGGNASFSVTASNATSYQWQENTGSGFSNITNGGIYSGATTSTFNITGATVSMNGYLYRCVVTGNCSPTATSNSATLTVNAGCTDPDVPTISGTTTICKGNSTTLSINTGNLNDATSWKWYTSSCGGTLAGSGTSINISPSVTTTYFVRGEGGCVTSGACVQVEVTVNSIDVSSTSSTNETCTGNDGTATVNPSGGSGNYSYTWSIGQTTQTATGLSAATYNVVVSDNITGCDANTDVVVNKDNCIPNTEIRSGFCGITLSDIKDLVLAYAVPGADEYQYQIIEQGTQDTLTFNYGIYKLKLAWFSGIKYNTTYSVGVRVRIGSDWGEYSNYCNITTPVMPTPNIQASVCGSTLTNIEDLIYVKPVTKASQYEYKLTEKGTSNVYFWTNTIYRIRLTWFGTQIKYNTTYELQARANVNGDWGDYSTICEVTTPSLPEPLIKNVCGTTLSNIDDLIFVQSVKNATNYEYELKEQGTSNVYYWNNSIYRFKLPWFTDSIKGGTVYELRARAYVQEWGNYGSVCQVTTPSSGAMVQGTIARIMNQENEDKEVVQGFSQTTLTIYPNPNQGEYLYVELNDLGNDAELIITDIYGKQVQKEFLNTEDSNYNLTVKFNQKLESGFYLVTVISNGHSVTKKLVVR